MKRQEDFECNCGYKGAIGELKYEVTKTGCYWVCPKCGDKAKKLKIVEGSTR